MEGSRRSSVCAGAARLATHAPQRGRDGHGDRVRGEPDAVVPLRVLRLRPVRQAGREGDPAGMRSAASQRRSNARQRRQRRAWRKKGFCPKCGKPAEPERSLCARHAAGNRAEKRRHDRRRRAAGVCTRCKRRAFRGGLCRPHYRGHLAYMRQYQRDWSRAQYRKDVAARRCPRCRVRKARLYRAECAKCAGHRRA